MTANINRDVFGVQSFSIAAGIEALETIIKSNQTGTVVPTLWSEDARIGWFPNYIELDQVEEISQTKTFESDVEITIKEMSVDDQVAAVVDIIKAWYIARIETELNTLSYLHITVYLLKVLSRSVHTKAITI